MDSTAQDRAMELLGHFNDQLTHVIDDAYGTQWAEIEEIVAIVTLVSAQVVSTRQLAEVSGLDRRAVSRLVARLRSEGQITTRQSPTDRRVIEVVLTESGERRAAGLRRSVTELFRESRDIAREISSGMNPTAQTRVPDTSPDPMDLLRRVCQAGAALVRFMPEAATQGQLAARQRAALVQIATQGGVRPTDLSPSLGVSRAGAAYIVDQLCAKGFVLRRRGGVPDDRRAVVLEATIEGIHAVRSVLDGIEHHRELFAGLFAEVAQWGQTEPDADRTADGGAVTRGASG